MDEPEHSAENGNQATPYNGQKNVNPGIDIKQLADRVYRLMMEEVRRERARGVQHSARRRGR